MSYDEELVSGFIDETVDVLDDVEPTLIELSKGGDASVLDSETINSVFRLFHSLKSSAAFLGFANIASLTHDAENVLQGVRDGNITLTTPLIGTLCKSMDLIRNMLESIESQQNDEGFEDPIHVNKSELQQYLGGPTPPPAQQSTEEEVIQNPGSNAGGTPMESPKVTAKQDAVFEDILITDEMRLSFIAEGTEQLETVEQCFLQLEKNNDDPQIMHTAYRAIHSFKGNSGFMHFHDLQDISHMLETVMEHMKDGKIEPESGSISFMLATIDTLRETVVEMSDGGNGSVATLSAYKDLILDVFPGCFTNGVPVIDSAEPATSEPTLSLNTVTNDSQVAENQAAELIAKPVEVAPTQNSNSKENTPTKKRKSIVRQDIRVDLSKLDTIINLVGELVIAESMVTRNPAVEHIDDERYYRSTHQLRRICNELQDASMSLRMVPLDGLFKKMVRVVHDLSQKIDKDINLEILGGDTEVDKTVIEQISDPLVHIVRNSCDHGIETTEERKKTGKAGGGHITIEGRHEGGEVWIIVKDDGRGLNKNMILKKAIANGIIRDGDTLADKDIWQLIFHPGFSTAEKITNVSGRGVGMDVVKKNVEKLSGRIDIKTTEGSGSSIIIRIPLTLAIIDGMLVQVGESKYTVPTLSIKRSLRYKEDQVTYSPEGNAILRLDDKFIPIIRLGKLFGHGDAVDKLEDGILIVVDDGGNQIALFADDIIGQQQTVIKGLSPYINGARGTSGCTILGDGSVALILDIRTLVGMAEDISRSISKENSSTQI